VGTEQIVMPAKAGIQYAAAVWCLLTASSGTLDRLPSQAMTSERIWLTYGFVAFGSSQ
jgi:hypothetical protein